MADDNVNSAQPGGVAPQDNWKVAKGYGEYLTSTSGVSDTGIASWRKIHIDRPSYSTVPAGARPIQYQNHPPSVADAVEGTCEFAPDGRCFFLSKGDWFVRIPTVGGTTENVTLVIHDGSSSSPMQQEQASTSTPGAIPNAGITWTSFAQITVNAADTAVVSAAANRRGLSLINTSTGGQVIAITDEAAATAATRGVWILQPNQAVYIDTNCPIQAFRAWASAAGGKLSGATGV
jgi:hypothetical protein